METHLANLYLKILKSELTNGEATSIDAVEDFLEYFCDHIAEIDHIKRKGLAGLVFTKIALMKINPYLPVRAAYYFLTKDINDPWYDNGFATESISQRLMLIYNGGGGMKLLNNETQSPQELDFAILADWLRLKDTEEDIKKGSWWSRLNEDAIIARNKYPEYSDEEIIKCGEEIHIKVSIQAYNWLK